VTDPNSQGRAAPWRSSFRAHLTVLVVAVILPLAGLSFYSMTRLGDAEREMNRGQIISTARAISSNIDQQLLSAERNLRALTSTLPKVGSNLDDFYAHCRAIAQENGGWILLADPDGRQIFNTKRPLGTPLPPLLGTPEMWETMASGKSRISNAFTATVDPQPQFSVYVPVIADGRVTHILAMTFPTRMLNELLAQQNLPEHWTGSVIDRSGTIFARHPRSEKTVGLRASPEILAMPEDQSEGFFRFVNVEGTPVYFASARSSLSGWKVGVGIPQSLIDAPLRQNLQRFALLGAAVLLLAVGAAAIIGRRLSDNMKTLAKAAYALARHEPLPTVTSTVDEVNRVATALISAGLALDERDRQLRRSQQHLLRAQHVGGMGSMDRNLKTGEVECTDETFCLYGVDRASFEPTTENFIQLVHEDDRERVRTTTIATRRGAKPEPMEYRIVRPDGAVRTVWREAELTWDEQGVPIHLLVTVKDVTELRAAERQLRRSQQHLALAQRASQTGSVLRDRKTGVDEWSDELYRLLGLERGVHQPAFATFLQLVHAEDRPVLAAMREAFQRGDPRPMARFRINRPDGEPRVLESVVSLLSDQAEPSSRVLIIFRDVTELHAAEQRQRDLERQLQHSQKLDALGTLAGGIAHDLNNTLVPIMGLAKITMRHVPSGSRGHDNLATILRASQRARDLVGQILAFSRHEKPTRERVDLAALTSEALAMLRASVPATARIAESIEAVPPVLGDAGQLHQVIVNLVVNAAQAIGGDMGTITVALGAEARALPEGAGAAPPGPCVHLSVRDTGCGMNEATLARVFDPFFTTKPVGGGTGLGLSVVHGIVAQHGGHLTVESRLGRGTRFDVYLPAHDTGDDPLRVRAAEMAT
jgi:PAS domain S-box-containing protein